ncbi:hypothetical protein T265_05740 [Opisthorchis viverrini]|uniref:Uncharacterized protein n=1 Tax=Opisthorchis viverrini TaxID=6198 RepID=A0A075AEZ1_OPIVI|nr:hypothetical protein T265_05740 [Opisthorchis viverrini]KER27209.1 hypothetical protein T265_05740 [Opisthorchis viverrini]
MELQHVESARNPKPQTWFRDFCGADFSGMRIFLEQVTLGPAPVEERYRITVQKVPRRPMLLNHASLVTKQVADMSSIGAKSDWSKITTLQPIMFKYYKMPAHSTELHGSTISLFMTMRPMSTQL